MPESAPASAPCVLVVDDDDNVRRVVLRQLARLGYRTVEAADGAGALARLAETGDVALLLVDVSMPGGMNGPEVAEHARRTRPGLKVLFASGNVDQQIAASEDFIVKPYRKEELARKLHEILPSGPHPLQPGARP
ncbi:MAG: response regulator [Enhydrobacter sp.]|nr:MAG: response regulator [Enhydrobacter sp.]